MYVKEISKDQLKTELPLLRSGQTVRVHQKIKEGEKERVQLFEGQVIAVKHGQGINGTFTVRKISSGVGVERIFPFHTPTLIKVEVARDQHARRSKLYYTRQGKEAKLKGKKK